MAILPVPHSGSSLRRRVAPMLCIAMAAALNLTPLGRVAALDRQPPAHMAMQGPPADPTHFPGSAYFLAEDAFPPVSTPEDDAVVPDNGSPHVFAIDPGPAALSMPIRSASALDQARALQCLTNAIFYEAGNEPEEGQRAVAQVVLNRIASGQWPNSVCGAIYQGGERTDRRCQFTFSCDGTMARPGTGPGWVRARSVAARALAGEVFAPVGLATYYHTLAVHPPWADTLTKSAIVGAHIFYRLPGAAGAPAIYRNRYGGAETAQPGPYAFVPPPVPVVQSLDTAPIATSQLAPLIPGPTASPGPASAIVPTGDGLPRSDVRPEYRSSGRAIAR